MSSMGDNRVCVGRGGGVGGNLRVIVVRVFGPVFQNLPHSYTWLLKKIHPFIYLIFQNVDLFIYYPWAHMQSCRKCCASAHMYNVTILLL